MDPVATLLFSEHPSWIGDARIYRVDPPYQGHDCISVTVFPVEDGQWQNGGIMVVGCDENGQIHAQSIEPLWQSFVVMLHVEVLGMLGYRLAEVT